MRFKFCLFLICSYTINSFSQEADPIIFKIDDTPYYKSEIIYNLNKDSEQKSNIPTSDFLNSFINLKLNVTEAKRLGLDNTADFRRQYSSNRIQLANRYDKDTIFREEYIKKIYDRTLENIDINHVMLAFNQTNLFPTDTLKLYNQALILRNKLLKEGFKNTEYIDNSENPGIVQNWETINGHLGWIEPFMLSPSVEDAAYSLPIGEISMPIRSPKGYHLIQVLGKRKTQDVRSVEQVLFNFPQIPANSEQIDSVRLIAQKAYNEVAANKNFNSLCEEYSNAFETGDKKCDFGIVELNSPLPPSFINAVYDLKQVGDISKPVMTDFGFHIIRIKNSYPLHDYAALRTPILNRIKGTDRRFTLFFHERERRAKKFNYKLNEQAYESLTAIANTISPEDSLFINKVQNRRTVLFTINGEKEYTIEDLLDYIKMQNTLLNNQDEFSVTQVHQVKLFNLSTDILKEKLEEYAGLMILEYADATLEERYSDFKFLMTGFADGILSFDIMQSQVWDKINDKELEAYFDKNKSKYISKEKKSEPAKTFNDVKIKVTEDYQAQLEKEHFTRLRKKYNLSVDEKALKK